MVHSGQHDIVSLRNILQVLGISFNVMTPGTIYETILPTLPRLLSIQIAFFLASVERVPPSTALIVDGG
jgi:hypothetical protein